MTTPHITIDTRWSLAIILTLVLQLWSFIWFISKLESRVEAIETQAKQTIRYPYSDGKLLEQKLDFFLWSINEIKSDIKDIKNTLK